MSGVYPLGVEVDPPFRVARWRPLFNWILTIPLYLWSNVLGYGAAVVALVGWFAVVFTGRLPQSLGDFLMAVLRYQWRLLAYLYGLSDRYPSFGPIAGYVDPGDYPAVLYSARPVKRRRLSVLFRAVLIIPHLVALFLVSIAAFVALFVGWWAVLITGRWPRRLQSFVVGWLRWSFRVSGYGYLVTDVYPPFGFRE